ncbi:MAG: flagellar biosynthesis protein FlhB [Pseudomonadota bacterium]
MAEQDSSERTEQATPKKQQDARKKGQVPRSRELSTALLLISSIAFLMMTFSFIYEKFSQIALKAFVLSRREIYSTQLMLDAYKESMYQGFISITPLMLLTFIIALFAPIALGGWTFNFGSAGFKGNRMSPLKGFKRMFGVQALVELIKAIGKFVLVVVISYFILNSQFDTFMSLGTGDIENSILHGLVIVSWSFLAISSSLLFIAAIDVPYQMWNHAKQLKMTKQEIKDEYKNTEGKPEVKGRIRRMQREIADRRMMQQVPDADVVITNPEHYSVALKYDKTKSSAPIVVAKGVELMALQIRKIAAHNDVLIVEAPPLARSIYFTTDIDKEIPEGLYLAVAQLLAYVYQLKEHIKGKGPKPDKISDYPIPANLQH